MAAPALPALALRNVPPGADPFAHRGHVNLVRVASTSFLSNRLRPDAFTPDPDDNTTPCLPYHVVEGLYSRIGALDASASAVTFGGHCVGIDWLNRADQILSRAEGGGIAPQPNMTLTSLLYVVNMHSVRAHDAPALYIADFTATQPFAAAHDVHQTWLSDLTATQVPPRAWGDLALLVGPRTLAPQRLLGSSSPYATTLLSIARRAAAAEAIELPAAQPAQAPIAAIPAVAGRGRGRGRVAAQPGVPGQPARPARPLPSSPADQDVLAAVGDWLESSALPFELQMLPSDAAACRRELQARVKITESKTADLIRTRYQSFLLCFPALSAVLAGAPTSTQLEKADVLRMSLREAKDAELTSVSAYHILEKAVAKRAYVLNEGGGASAVPINDRVNALIEAADVERERHDAAPKASSVVAADGSPFTASGGPAFLKDNRAALDNMVRAHSNAMLTQLHAAGSDGDSAIAAGGKRILRVAFNQRLPAVMQFILNKTSGGGGTPMFQPLIAAKTSLIEYMSEATFGDEHGVLPEDLAGVLMDKNFCKLFYEGKDWPSLDLFNHCVTPIEEKRGRFATVQWPRDVFSNAEHVQKLMIRGNLLFGSLGYSIDSQRGFRACLQEIHRYLDQHQLPGENSADELHNIYQLFMTTANANYLTAMASDASASFPIFSEPFDTDAGAKRLPWKVRIDQLVASAKIEVAARLRRGTAPAPAPTHATNLVSFAPPSSPAPPTKRQLDSLDGVRLPAPKRPSEHASPSSASGVGSNSHWVLSFNESTLKMKFPDYNFATTKKWHLIDYDVRKCRQHLQDTEGNKDLCLPCAVCKKPALRYTLCPHAGQAGHESPTSHYHVFKSEPWARLNDKGFCTRVGHVIEPD